MRLPPRDTRNKILIVALAILAIFGVIWAVQGGPDGCSQSDNMCFGSAQGQ